jgi:glycosyltransferase involved in cell wall biosynthesis
MEGAGDSACAIADRYTMSSYSVVIPAYQEEDGIASVIATIRAHNPACEIIVVDDGSTDRTAAVAEKAGAVVLRHPANAGYGRSVMDGILAASHDVIVISDADGSYPVERIPDLVRKIDEGFDMAVGARQGTKQFDSILKVPARLLFKFLVEFTIGSPVPDINSGLRSFRKSQALPYFPDLCQGFSLTTSLTLIYKLTGKFIAYLPIDYRKRIGRSKVHVFRDSLRTLQYITEIIVTYNPLKLFLLLAMIPALLALIAFLGFMLAPQPAFVIVASILVGCSFLLFGIGLLAYLRKREVGRRGGLRSSRVRLYGSRSRVR